MSVRKHIKVTAFLLAFTLVAVALPTRVGREGIFDKTALVANALDTKNISPDELELHDDGSIKSFRLSYYIDYYAPFKAKLIITDKALNRFGSVVYSASTEADSLNLAAQEGVNVVANGSSYVDAIMESTNSQIIYADQGKVLSDGTTYYVYLWTWRGSSYYKDSDLGSLTFNSDSNIWEFSTGIKTTEVVEGTRYATTLNFNGGSDSTQTIYTVYSDKKQDTLTFPSPVEGRFGYNFLGWNESASSSEVQYEAGAEITPDTNKTYYAIWEKKGAIVDCSNVRSVSDITVSGHSEFNGSTKYLVTTGGEVTFASKTKLKFSSGSFKEKISGDTYTYTGPVSNDVTVQTAYTVSFETNGGTKIADVIVPYGTYISLNGYRPSKNCYSFAGWYNDDTLTTPSTSTYVRSDVTYYAKWEEDHAWSDTYEWNDAHTECTEHRVCITDSSHKKDVIYTKHEAVPATCTEDGNIEYFTCNDNSLYYTLTGENTFTAVDSVTVKAGHNWGVPKYKWADDNSTCTKTIECKNDSSHRKEETVDTTSEIEGNEIIYKADFSNKQTKYSHTENINDEGVESGDYNKNSNTNEVVTIEGAEKLHVKLTYQTEGTGFDWACVWEGKHPEYTAYRDFDSGLKNGNTNGKYGDRIKSTIEFDVNGDSVTFGFHSDGVINNYYGYYAVVTGGTTDVQTKRESYGFAPTYTVTIPADVNLSDDDRTRTVSAKYDIGDQILKVTLDTDFTMTEQTDNSVKANYTIRCGNTPFTDISKPILNVTGNGSTTADLTFDVDESTVLYAGNYSDTIMFDISVE